MSELTIKEREIIQSCNDDGTSPVMFRTIE